MHLRTGFSTGWNCAQRERRSPIPSPTSARGTGNGASEVLYLRDEETRGNEGNARLLRPFHFPCIVIRWQGRVQFRSVGRRRSKGRERGNYVTVKPDNVMRGCDFHGVQ